jgi:hypothetical protein
MAGSSGNSGKYDPTSALKAVRDALKQYEPSPARGRLLGPDEKPIGQPIAPAYEMKEGPAVLCFLLREWAEGQCALPDDFDDLPKSGKALKEHVRPDGGVYLGAFDSQGDPLGVIIMFGDPALPLRQAIDLSLEFRAHVHATNDLSGEADAPLPLPKLPLEIQ